MAPGMASLATGENPGPVSAPPGDGPPGRRRTAARSRPSCTPAWCSTEAWPSISWTARMSAPWSSMCVAHECRSTWGVSLPSRPDPRPPAPDHQPGALAGQPAAPPVEEHGVGVAPALPLLGDQRRPAAGAEPVHERGDGVAADRHDPLLRPLAERPQQRRLEVDVAEPQAHQLRDPQPGPVEHLEDGPVAPGHAARRPADGGQQRLDLGLGQRLGKPGGHPGRLDVGAGVARIRPSSARNRCSDRAATTARATWPAPARRRAGAPTYASTSASRTSSSAEAPGAQPCAPAPRRRAGRPPAWTPPGPSRSPATTATPRPRAAAASASSAMSVIADVSAWADGQAPYVRRPALNVAPGAALRLPLPHLR